MSISNRPGYGNLLKRVIALKGTEDQNKHLQENSKAGDDTKSEQKKEAQPEEISFPPIDSSRKLKQLKTTIAEIGFSHVEENKNTNPESSEKSKIPGLQKLNGFLSPTGADLPPTASSTPTGNKLERRPSFWVKMKTKIHATGMVKDINKNLVELGTGEQLLDINRRGVKKVAQTLDPSAMHIGEDDETQECCICYPESTFMQIWSCIIVLLLLYTAYGMPYRLAFMETTSNAWFIADLFIDGLFLTDCVINLNLAFPDENGNFVTSHKEIFLNYLNGWLIFDLVLSFPMGVVERYFFSPSFDPRMLRLIRLPRLYRLLRINKLFGLTKFFKKNSFFDEIEDFFLMNPGLTRFISFMATVLTCTHVIGCLWCYCARLYMYSPDTWVARKSMQDSYDGELYLSAIYWALQTLLTVGYGDFPPYTDLEVILTICWMTFGAGVFSYSVGNLSTIMSNLDSQSSSLALKLENLDQFCKDMKVGKDLRDELKKDLEYRSRNGLFSMIDKQSVILELPQHIKSEVFSICIVY